MNNNPAANLVSEPRQAVHARGLPVIGLTVDLLRDRLKLICDLRDRGDIVRYHLAGNLMYLINHPAGVQRVLQDNNRNYPRGKIFAMMRAYFGNGLVFSDGEFWLRQRRLMQPMFHNRHVIGYAGEMRAAAQDLSADWHKAAKSGQPVDISRDLTYLTMRVVTRALFSSGVEGAEGDLGEAITVLLDELTFRFDVPFYPPTSVPTLRNLRYRKAVRTLDSMLYGVIQQRRAMAEDQRPRDLLTMLIEARDDDGQGMSDQQLRDEVLTMFAAGHETTANALTWAYYLLASHPEIEQRLQSELQGILGGRAPGEEDFSSLRFTRNVIDETLRLYPPAWITNRQAHADDQIMGCPIPAGAVMTLSPYAMHRDPRFWPDPEIFDPDRFTPERSADRPRYAYFPFGGGPHQCIGQGFALLEAVLVIATLSQQFQLRLAPGFTPKTKPSLTLRPKDGMWMQIVERA
jgi:cytochrome P450